MDRFSGDPKLSISERGSTLDFVGGQPVMEQGAANATIISLHTRSGWCGNVFVRKPDNKIGSDYELAQEQPVTLSSLNTIRNAAIAALSWMAPTKIEVAVSNPTGQLLRTIVRLTGSAKKPLVAVDSKTGAVFNVEIG